jgi:hypothetical protein
MLLDLLIWFVLFGAILEPEIWVDPTEAQPRLVKIMIDEPTIDEFGGRWKVPGFSRVPPLTNADVNPGGRYPMKMDGQPMGLPRFPLEAVDALLGPWPERAPRERTYNKASVYRYPQAIWLMADDAPGVFLVLGKGRWGVPVFITTGPYPYLAGNADQTYRMPAIRALAAKVTEIMAAQGRQWP